MNRTATPEDRALVEAYLARAATLTPADWGRLDAIGARLANDSPFGLLARAQIDGAVNGLWNYVPRTVATGSALAVRALFWATVRVMVVSNELTDPTHERLRQRAEDQRRQFEALKAKHPEVAQNSKDITDLSAICAGQPGGSGGIPGLHTNAGRALYFGLLALRSRSRLSASAFETVYMLVDPVIPFRTLVGSPTLLSNAK
jgi:hypothetical protein